jgi:ABC-type hemin transport system substrate-binding protein
MMTTTSRRAVLCGLLAVAASALPAAADGTPPRRIVSTAPSITETLFALGLGDRVVGVSQYCRHPPSVLALPKVGSLLKPDVETIARLGPDLVLTGTRGDGFEGRLRAVGLRFANVDRGTGLAGVYEMIGAIAEAAAVPDRGRALVADIQRRLAALGAQGRRGTRPRVLLIVGRRPGTLSDIVAVGRKAYLGELIELVGGANVLDDPALPEYPRISLETVIRSRPDVVIDTGDMGEDAPERARQAVANLALWRAEPLASGIRRIHAATADALVVPGPRVVEAADWLHSLIHDDRVP